MCGGGFQVPHRQRSAAQRSAGYERTRDPHQTDMRASLTTTRMDMFSTFISDLRSRTLLGETGASHLLTLQLCPKTETREPLR